MKDLGDERSRKEGFTTGGIQKTIWIAGQEGCRTGGGASG